MIDRYQQMVIWAGCKLTEHKVKTATELPWRKERSPYRVLLAELLLVRTRADVVARVYHDILEQFPDIYELAKSNEDQLGTLLRPLGLPQRVPYIIKAAKYICKEFNGTIPDDIKLLIRIPGVGLYTATAVAAFAYDQPLVPSDVNILRFLSRLTGLEMENRTKGSRRIRELTEYLSEKQIGLNAEHLLDFTRLVCRPRSPRCDECPLAKHCDYFLGGIP